MKLLATAAGAAAIVTGALYLVPAPIPPNTSWYDKSILYIIAFVCTACTVVMLASRRTWTIRAVGLLFMLTSFAVLAWNAVYIRQKGYTIRDGRVVSNADPGVSEMFGDVWRALILIGGPMLLVGIAFYVHGRFGPASAEPFLGERRVSEPRREEDKQMRAENMQMRARLQELERSL